MCLCDQLRKLVAQVRPVGRMSLEPWSVFFNLRVVSKSPTEISTPIGAVLELCSRANLPCFVKLAHRV